MIETHHERRIALLESQLREACATAEGYRLALEEAERLVAEVTCLHICEAGEPKRKKWTTKNR